MVIREDLSDVVHSPTRTVGTGCVAALKTVAVIGVSECQCPRDTGCLAEVQRL